ncbi:MAG: DUF4142 domain-containing protein [Terriglobia bacterium]
MRIERLLQTVVISAGICAAQQNQGAEPATLQHQRLAGTSANTGATTASGTHNADAVNPTLLDIGAGSDQGNVGHFTTMADKQFAKMLAARSLMAIKLGNVAVERSSNDAVKQVGREMVAEYTKWSIGMAKASNGLGIKLPSELDSKQQATFNRISKLSGIEFDTAYLKEMVTIQNKALTVAQYEATNAGIPGFRHWAGVMVPIIQGQLEDTKRAMDGAEARKQ